jgi:hypothetical protein
VICCCSAGQAEAARAEQKVDNLQRLCRTLQAENKLLEDTNKRSREDFAAAAEVRFSQQHRWGKAVISLHITYLSMVLLAEIKLMYVLLQMHTQPAARMRGSHQPTCKWLTIAWFVA